MSIWNYANPTLFMSLSQRILPTTTVITLVLIITGTCWGFFLTPNDYQQGSSVKIIFLHVPAALIAINSWFVMLISSLIWLIRRHHISALVAKAAAPIGLTMTLVAIITGMIWGQQMWGTYWAWDPRLTSFLILLLFYIGYQTLWRAVENPDVCCRLNIYFMSCWYYFCDSKSIRSELLEPRPASRSFFITRQRRTYS